MLVHCLLHRRSAWHHRATAGAALQGRGASHTSATNSQGCKVATQGSKPQQCTAGRGLQGAGHLGLLAASRCRAPGDRKRLHIVQSLRLVTMQRDYRAVMRQLHEHPSSTLGSCLPHTARPAAVTSCSAELPATHTLLAAISIHQQRGQPAVINLAHMLDCCTHCRAQEHRGCAGAP